jgi:hypothetical protein
MPILASVSIPQTGVLGSQTRAWGDPQTKRPGIAGNFLLLYFFQHKGTGYRPQVLIGAYISTPAASDF